ncbi:hypothetical protein ACJIZ3_024689 [Penstemon smallii]|uniref:BZIP domain-containing protein n=1 Tax=Penstemon smallii TaxID=265156 RepID=A0ABD3TUR9_9LAMI
MMDPKFAGKPINSNTYPPTRTDLDQMPDTPTRGSHHRRALSETFFRFPDFDSVLLDDVMSDLNLDLPPTPPSLFPSGPPPQQQAQSRKAQDTRAPAHLRSLSVDADFFDGLMLDGPFSAQAPAEVGPSSGQRHRRSNSVDGYSSATSSEVDPTRKAMAADRLAELSLIDPKRAKRILANRQSAARSKERKTRYTSELERKVQTLQTEATTLSAQITLLQRDTSGLTAENKELKLKLQAIEQQAHLRDALNEALRDELNRLKIAAGQIPVVNGNNRGGGGGGSPSQFSSRPPTFNYFGNHQPQHQQQTQQPLRSNDPRLSGQSQPSFPDFNRRVG